MSEVISSIQELGSLDLRAHVHDVRCFQSQNGSGGVRQWWFDKLRAIDNYRFASTETHNLVHYHNPAFEEWGLQQMNIFHLTRCSVKQAKEALEAAGFIPAQVEHLVLLAPRLDADIRQKYVISLGSHFGDEYFYISDYGGEPTFGRGNINCDLYHCGFGPTVGILGFKSL